MISEPCYQPLIGLTNDKISYCVPICKSDLQREYPHVYSQMLFDFILFEYI